MIGSITLRRVLPKVFRGSENERRITGSSVWLARELRFERPMRYIVESESGAGKSSLCSFIYGERTDYDGEILFDNTPVRELDIDGWCALRRESLAYLPQDMRLFPELTVMENILLKNRLTDFRSEAEILRQLERLEISEKADKPAGMLSIGQQQRAALVRALCQPFDFLLVDEPVSHLDARNNATVAALIDEEASSRDAAVIVTSVGNNLSLRSFIPLQL